MGTETGRRKCESKASDERSTPLPLYDALNRIFGFKLDAAATAENAKCARFYTKDDDALSKPWDGPVFLNPPYSRSNLAVWLDKAVIEATKGTVVVSIVPGDFSTKWFARIWKHARYLLFLSKRVKFNGMATGAKTPTLVAIFGAPRGNRDLAAYIESFFPGSKCLVIN